MISHIGLLRVKVPSNPAIFGLVDSAAGVGITAKYVSLSSILSFLSELLSKTCIPTVPSSEAHDHVGAIGVDSLPGLFLGRSVENQSKSASKLLLPEASEIGVTC